MYARISSDPNDTALGGKRQIKDCQALAEARGWTVGEVITDNDVSATRAKPRPAYEQMTAKMALLALVGPVGQAMAWSSSQVWLGAAQPGPVQRGVS